MLIESQWNHGTARAGGILRVNIKTSVRAGPNKTFRIQYSIRNSDDWYSRTETGKLAVKLVKRIVNPTWYGHLDTVRIGCTLRFGHEFFVWVFLCLRSVILQYSIFAVVKCLYHSHYYSLNLFCGRQFPVAGVVGYKSTYNDDWIFSQELLVSTQLHI